VSQSLFTSSHFLPTVPSWPDPLWSSKANRKVLTGGMGAVDFHSLCAEKKIS